MYPRNAATPERIPVGAVVQISDGAVQTSGVSVVVRPQGGSETAGGGTVSYGASSGIVYYQPTQAETNYTSFVVAAYKTGCVPVAVGIVTTANATAGRVSVGDVAGTAQTGGDLASLITTVDTVADGIKAKTDSLTFTVSGKVDANITHVIADPVQASSSKTTNWGGTP